MMPEKETDWDTSHLPVFDNNDLLTLKDDVWAIKETLSKYVGKAIHDTEIRFVMSHLISAFGHAWWTVKEKLDRILEEDMCPNCVTPWECNGPHEPTEERKD